MHLASQAFHLNHTEVCSDVSALPQTNDPPNGPRSTSTKIPNPRIKDSLAASSTKTTINLPQGTPVLSDLQLPPQIMVSYIGRKNCLSQGSTAEVDIQPMGLRSHLRLQDRANSPSLPDTPTTHSGERRTSISKELINLLEKGAVQEVKHQVEPGFVSRLFLVPWTNETSNRPQTIQSLCSLSSLQDGGFPSSEGHTAAQRLDGQNRPQGRILFNSSAPRVPEILEVYLREENVSVHMPSLRSLIRTKSVHQNFTTKCGFLPQQGNSLRDIPRRSTPVSSDERDPERACSHSTDNSRSSRIPYRSPPWCLNKK